MDSPADFFDEDEAVFPCKGCGEILEEGKAFELGEFVIHIPTSQSSCAAFQSQHSRLEHSWPSISVSLRVMVSCHLQHPHGISNIHLQPS
jgi:hypothetical protein